MNNQIPFSGINPNLYPMNNNINNNLDMVIERLNNRINRLERQIKILENRLNRIENLNVMPLNNNLDDNNMYML